MGEENGDDLWVFGYGSLIWKPGFDYVERAVGRLGGYTRRFCLRSISYRGTPDAPGLVLGLDPDPDGACDGVAFRVAAGAAGPCRAYLRERELINGAYREVIEPVRLADGRAVAAMTYVIDHAHPQYAGVLPLEEQAAVIARAVGPMGPNAEYLENTVTHLAALDLPDPELERLAALVRARRG